MERAGNVNKKEGKRSYERDLRENRVYKVTVPSSRVGSSWWGPGKEELSGEKGLLVLVRSF